MGAIVQPRSLFICSHNTLANNDDICDDRFAGLVFPASTMRGNGCKRSADTHSKQNQERVIYAKTFTIVVPDKFTGSGGLARCVCGASNGEWNNVWADCG